MPCFLGVPNCDFASKVSFSSAWPSILRVRPTQRAITPACPGVYPELAEGGHPPQIRHQNLDWNKANHCRNWGSVHPADYFAGMLRGGLGWGRIVPCPSGCRLAHPRETPSRSGRDAAAGPCREEAARLLLCCPHRR
jgi:hypothetical protein